MIFPQAYSINAPGKVLKMFGIKIATGCYIWQKSVLTEIVHLVLQKVYNTVPKNSGKSHSFQIQIHLQYIANS